MITNFKLDVYFNIEKNLFNNFWIFYSNSTKDRRWYTCQDEAVIERVVIDLVTVATDLKDVVVAQETVVAQEYVIEIIMVVMDLVVMEDSVVAVDHGSCYCYYSEDVSNY